MQRALLDLFHLQQRAIFGRSNNVHHFADVNAVLSRRSKTSGLIGRISISSPLTSQPKYISSPRTCIARSFRSTARRRDVFFVSVPAFKAALLAITRITLVTLPFWWRWRLFKRYPKASRILLQIPLFAVILVFALGINQSPHTARWRLLLMSEREEQEWSQSRFQSIMAEHPTILPEDDSRTKVIKRICDRLISSLALMDTPCVNASSFLSDSDEETDRFKRKRGTHQQPSATTVSALMPFKPPSSNPTKVLEESSWELYIVKDEAVNAFVLPTKEIFISSGLIDLLDSDEALLAAVLSHEISHVMERHAVENMGFLALSSVAFDVLRGISWAATLSFPFVNDGLAVMINFMNNTVAERAYSRKLETEADKLGLQVLASAGYDPNAAAELWQFLVDLKKEEATEGAHSALCDHIKDSPLLRTHPTGEDRLEAIRKAMPHAMEIFKNSNITPVRTARTKEVKLRGDRVL